MTQEFTRNDVAAIKVLGKIMDRLEADKAAYEAHREAQSAAINNLNAMLSGTQLQAQQAAQSQYQAAMQQLGGYSQNYVHFTPGSTRHANIAFPEWEPTLTRSEYATLKAWADGEEIILHVLAEER
ncbi:hypothetical protein [Rhizobium sp. L43]|uniref:hypothetical protein n=1 Tax=Rhizobium sp. L43 TaxID=2035452 RepID=UPI000BE84ED9|nr:hypothetical protein [Rhizobium sp. L43]PDS75467.1 hypothetical protein CO667_26660 [Rhizobium sp. L43]